MASDLVADGEAALGERGQHGRRAGVGVVGEGGGDVDDVAAASLEHLGDGALRQPEEAGEVDADHRRVVLGGVVGERLGDEHARRC